MNEIQENTNCIYEPLRYIYTYTLVISCNSVCNYDVWIIGLHFAVSGGRFCANIYLFFTITYFRAPSHHYYIAWQHGIFKTQVRRQCQNHCSHAPRNQKQFYKCRFCVFRTLNYCFYLCNVLYTYDSISIKFNVDSPTIGV